MKYNLSRAKQILERTPNVISSMLAGIDDSWTSQNEGGESWSPFDIVGHLIHGEKTDWISRAEIILAQGENRTFESFDRFAQFESSKGKQLSDLLGEFSELRAANLVKLDELQITPAQYDLNGVHPELGAASLKELLATWVVHDLGHIAQIARVMAKQYKDEVGPWTAYIPVLQK